MAEWHQRRTANATMLIDTFLSLPGLRTPVPAVDIEHAWYKFYCFVRPDALRSDWNYDRIMAEINAAGVPCFSGSCSEVYLEKAFDNTGWRPVERLPVAKELGETALMFLVHPTLTEAEMRKTCSVVASVMEQAAGI